MTDARDEPPDDGGRRAPRPPRFLGGDRIELGALAGELGLSRATLHRWFGHRDRLLGEVLWSLASDTLTGAEARAGGAGRDRLLATLGGFLGDMVGHPAFRRYLDTEPEAARRVLMTPRGDVERASSTPWRRSCAPSPPSSTGSA
jgi:hypothetical protein